MTKFSRTSTGKYSVAGKTYELLIGTRAQVWHGTAYKTSGGLTHSDLMKNKAGRIVSKAKHNSAKKDKRLMKAGYFTKKGHFGAVKKSRGGAGGINVSGPAPVLPPGLATTMKRGGRKGRKGTRSHRGGSGVSYALSPSEYNGKGVMTSGVGVQFEAGNA